MDGSVRSITDLINSKPYYTEFEKSFANSVLKQESAILKEHSKVKKLQNTVIINHLQAK